MRKKARELIKKIQKGKITSEKAITELVEDARKRSLNRIVTGNRVGSLPLSESEKRRKKPPTNVKKASKRVENREKRGKKSQTSENTRAREKPDRKREALKAKQNLKLLAFILKLGTYKTTNYSSKLSRKSYSAQVISKPQERKIRMEIKEQREKHNYKMIKSIGQISAIVGMGEFASRLTPSQRKRIIQSTIKFFDESYKNPKQKNDQLINEIDNLRIDPNLKDRLFYRITLAGEMAIQEYLKGT